MTLLFLTRELKNDHSNISFWTGKWYGSGLGAGAWSQPYREFCAKIIEMSHFAGDFILGHIILFCQAPIILFSMMSPFVDKYHSLMLFWLKPNRQIRPPIYSLKQARLRKRMIRKYASLYCAVLLGFVVMIAAPAAVGSMKNVDIASVLPDLPDIATGLFQPRHQDNNDTGSNTVRSWTTYSWTTKTSISTWSTKA